jgi:hypothetical protein
MTRRRPQVNLSEVDCRRGVSALWGRSTSRMCSSARLSVALSLLVALAWVDPAAARSPAERAVAQRVAAKRALAAKRFGALTGRIAADLKAGKPLVVTVHVALCDNRQIACGSRALGDGDQPRRNLYWGGAAGFKAFFDYRRRRWKRVLLDRGDGKVILERAVYRLRVRRPGARWRRLGVTKGFDVYLVGLAYRGLRIADAMGALISQVSRDARPKAKTKTETLKLADGQTLGIGAAGHVVGYAGHNHLMDVTSFRWPRWTRTRPLGYFALACMTAPYLTRRLSGRQAVGLLLTKTLMYPGAFTIEGLVRALAAGGDQRAVFRGGADAYARYQKRPTKRIRWAFTHDGRGRTIRTYLLAR